MSEHDISLQEVAKAVEGINKAWEDEKKAREEVAAEVKKFGAALPETQDKLTRLDAEIAKLHKITEEAVLAAKRASRTVTDEKGNEIDMDAKAADWARFVGKQTGMVDEAKGFNADAMGEYKRAFERLVRANMRVEMLSDAERKALSVGSQTDGGYFVDPDMTGRIVAKVYETSPVRAYASVQVISTDTLEGFYDNDEVGYGWVAELDSRAATTTPSVGKWSIPVHEMYAMPQASQKLLDDAAINIETWLSAKIADKFARAENNAFVVGDGIGKPKGFMAAAESTDLTVGVEQFDTGVSGGFAAAPAGGDVLISALYGLKAPYRQNATWFMNSSTFAAARKLKDSDGAYHWAPGIAVGQPATILGRPLATFEDMADISAGSLSIAVGDLGAAYQIVDRLGISMLRDPYSSKPYVLFYARKRTGGDVINGEALKFVKFTN